MVDDHGSPDFERKLGRQDCYCRSPDVVTRGTLANEMQQPANDDRQRSYCRKHAGAMLEKPSQSRVV